MEEIRAVDWSESPEAGLRLLDQTLLPGEERFVTCVTVDEIVDAIERLVVRGAPALGAVGAFGVAVALAQARREQWSPEELRAQVRRVRDARPTAVNLAWGVDRALPLIDQGLGAVVAEGRLLMAEDLEANRILSGHGADWIVKAVGGGADEPVRVLTHCNAGALATTGWGTALGVVRELHERGTLGRVYANETRPLLQGARLTAWELARLGIDHVVQVDAAAASTIVGGRVDVAVVGADRIAANGDAANKIGTLGVALACADAGDPLRGGRTDVHGRRRDSHGPRHLDRAPRRRRGGVLGRHGHGAVGQPRLQPRLRRHAGPPHQRDRHGGGCGGTGRRARSPLHGRGVAMTGTGAGGTGLPR